MTPRTLAHPGGRLSVALLAMMAMTALSPLAHADSLSGPSTTLPSVPPVSCPMTTGGCIPVCPATGGNYACPSPCPLSAGAYACPPPCPLTTGSYVCPNPCLTVPPLTVAGASSWSCPLPICTDCFTCTPTVEIVCWAVYCVSNLVTCSVSGCEPWGLAKLCGSDVCTGPALGNFYVCLVTSPTGCAGAIVGPPTIGGGLINCVQRHPGGACDYLFGGWGASTGIQGAVCANTDIRNGCASITFPLSPNAGFFACAQPNVPGSSCVVGGPLSSPDYVCVGADPDSGCVDADSNLVATLSPVCVPTVDGDGDHVPDAVESQLCGRQVTRDAINGNEVPGSCASSTDYTPEQTSQTVFLPKRVLVGDDNDGDGVPGSLIVDGDDCTVTVPAGTASCSAAPAQAIAVDPDDGDPNNPVNYQAVDDAVAAAKAAVDQAVATVNGVVQQALDTVQGAVDSVDGDGDHVPDGAEPSLCYVEDQNDPTDGTCTGSDYHPPGL